MERCCDCDRCCKCCECCGEPMGALTVGDNFPDFDLKAVKGGEGSSLGLDSLVDVKREDYEGKWLIPFFYPKDFTFVCPTEIEAFGKMNQEFLDRDAHVLAISVDSEFAHLAWRKANELVRDLPFPLVSDIKRDLSYDLGIIDKEAGVSQRATYIVDPDNVIRFTMITDLGVGRNPNEVLRVLDALQTDELCPCNWNKGDEVIKL